MAEQAERVAEVLRNQLRTAVEKATNLEETLMRQAGGPGGDLAALVERPWRPRAAPVEEESRAMHDKFAESTFTLVYTTLETFFGGLEQIIGS